MSDLSVNIREWEVSLGCSAINWVAGEPESVVFVWDAVLTADSYVLQVGSAVGLSNVYDANVGNVLTFALDLTPGTYYARVQAYAGASLVNVTDDQTVVV